MRSVEQKILFDNAKRVVVKVGSAVLTDDSGINNKVVENLVQGIVYLHDLGKEVILVSSGAVAAGRKKLQIDNSSSISLKEKQALAAIGQSSLMYFYDEIFSRYNKQIAQILLTHSDLSHRDRYLNVRNTIHTLFNYGTIPIVNENDTVSVEELRFGDNDTLGALITNLTDADIFICLTDVPGLFTGNPAINKDAKLVNTVDDVTKSIEEMAGNTSSTLGTGGMLSKIKAAKMVSSGGGTSFIGPGKEQDIIQKIFTGKNIGTLFLPSNERMPSRKHWIAHVLRPKGHIILDDGACKAIKKGGKSILPSGVMEVHGDFSVGDPIRCIDQNENIFAVGLTNYNSKDVAKIKQLHSDKIELVLGFKDSNELIHRDNLVLI